MNDLRIINIKKQFKQTERRGDPAFSLQPIQLTIREGEFFSLLGPSGCGKTTLLKLVAGLLQADSGEIWVGDTNLTKVPSESRKFAMVFQQSLLFPHMSVEDNVAFGLKMQKVGKKQRLDKARAMLERVGLAGYGSRLPDELSGGQQQRVALARALVANPRVLLMDEPFSALDPILREEMRELLGRIQKEFRVTVLFVTHDREEAFYLSDRIGIMNEGELLQVGNARDLYERPASTTAATFLGLKNIIEGTVSDGRFSSIGGNFEFAVNDRFQAGQGFLVLRPEAVELMPNASLPPKGSLHVSGVIQQLRFKHGFYLCKVQVGDEQLECVFSSRQRENATAGQKVDLMVDLKDVWIVEK
ncbi:putative spermidine/putrescine transport system ATP-binding protein [Planomicrobium koreense]|uniref:Carnitine transport ATP-binding protein OpuCA n=1 Tax=Planococcus koreensis TaxID=112331 RepID=A0A7W8CQX8_9BACL|nr:ABC transporter ATP-binding protein [Planococcus koreensis]MBB5178744.1 putative spermidine/putrescine transport system ATP-binding protein [Planococcus koreensis]